MNFPHGDASVSLIIKRRCPGIVITEEPNDNVAIAEKSTQESHHPDAKKTKNRSIALCFRPEISAGTLPLVSEAFTRTGISHSTAFHWSQIDIVRCPWIYVFAPKTIRSKILNADPTGKSKESSPSAYLLRILDWWDIHINMGFLMLQWKKRAEATAKDYYVIGDSIIELEN